MDLESKFLKAANRRINKKIQSRKLNSGEKKSFREILSNAHTVITAHTVLFTYRRRKLLLSCIAIFFAVPVVSLVLTANYTVYEYSYNGRVLGTAKTVEEVQSAIKMIEGSIVEDGDKKAQVAITSGGNGEQLSDDLVPGAPRGTFGDSGGTSAPLDVPVPVDEDQTIEVKKSIVPLTDTVGKVDTEDEIVLKIVKQSDIVVKAYEVLVDGKVLGIVASEDDAESLYEAFEDFWLQGTGADRADFEKIEFVEKVSTNPITVPLDKVESRNELFLRALDGVLNPRTYTIGPDETILDVSLRNGVTEQQLSEWNPTLEIDDLGPGTVLLLEEPKSLINIRTIEEGSYTSLIDYDVISEESDQFFLGEEITITPGVSGVKTAYGEIIRVNGTIVEYVEETSEILEESTPAFVKTGTKPIPPSIGTGTFTVPIEGLVTSLFGIRWGRLHDGIDFGAPIGTIVRASDGGKVTYAGWDGSYGVTVKIDHGAGFTTVYAHLNKAFVEVGQDVYQGQQIAESGNTGFSTGPHLHFCVYKFGVPVDGMQYLPDDLPMYLLSGVGAGTITTPAATTEE